MISRRILPRLMISFFLLSPLPLGGLAWFYLSSFEPTLMETISDNLTSVADKKTDQINSYLNEKMSDVAILSNSEQTLVTLKKMSEIFALTKKITNPTYQTYLKKFRPFFKTASDISSYYDIIIIDRAGNVVFSVIHEPDLGTNLFNKSEDSSDLARAFRETMKGMDTQVLLSKGYQASLGRAAIFIVNPVFADNQLYGAIAVQLDVDKLASVIADNTGLGVSGETLLAQRGTREALYVGPVKYEKDAAFRLSLPFSKLSQPMLAALTGDSDTGLTVDDSEKEVLAVWRYISSLRLGIVVKVDKDEAYTSLYRMRKTVLFALIVLLLLATFFAHLLAQSFVIPLQQFIRMTQLIASGQLKERAPVQRIEELNSLAQNFNFMAGSIEGQQSLLEARVQEKTKDLQKANDHYRELTDQILVGVFRYRLITMDTSVGSESKEIFEYVSAHFCEMFGLKSETALEEAAFIFNRAHRDEQSVLLQRKQQAALELVPFRWEGRFIIEGNTRWLLIESIPTVKNQSESLWHGTVADITERKIIELKLSKSEARFRSIFENANMGIIFTDAQGNILQVNKHFIEMLGYEEKDLLRSNVRVLIHPEDALNEALLLEAVNAKVSDSYQFEKRYLTPKKEIVWVKSAVAVIRDEQGEPLNFVRLLIDITERKKYERELIKSKEVAESASRAKSEFLANMSHEIRTPMNAILGLTELVLQTDLKAEQADYLRKVYSSSNALLGILNDILDYAKIEAGKLQIENIPMNVIRVIKESRDLFSAQIAQKELNCHLEIHRDVPTQVMGDPLRLSQILNNLIGNAVKFTNHGEIFVSVKAQPLEEVPFYQLDFSISDTGIGLSPEQVKSLFQAFSQADNSITRRYGGTGLGLSICSKLVVMMGGSIQVQSEEGKGSTFSFSIRAAAVNQGKGFVSERIREAEAMLPMTPELSIVNQVPNFAGAHVLLVEDNPINQLVASQLLKKLGVTVTVAQHGMEAVEMIEKEHFHAVLMDLHMPVMDGFEATQRIKEKVENQNLPIIALTAAVMPQDRERCAVVGIVDFIAKPMDLHGLGVVLSRWLGPLAPFKKKFKPVS